MEQQDARPSAHDPLEEATIRLIEAKLELQNAMTRLQLMNAVDLERLRKSDTTRTSKPAN